MSSVPIVQIRQTYGKIGIDADLGSYSIQQPKADMQISTRAAQLEIHQYQPELQIDQSRAFAAYTGGGNLEMTKRLYSSVQQIFLQGLAKRVEDGNRMAEFFKPGNSIAQIKGDWNLGPSFGEFRGPASSANVDVHFEVREPDIEVIPGGVDIDVTVNKPVIEYTRGKLDIYMQQYPSVQFIPPAVDTAV
ncbi:DUF6470 family protein [Paenibacillus sp. JX-17]|uniref:DUF6470 family protein n=1 Tax=Paenibacillus lacisoli TaxID=3064525 RepID=A0ABT9CD35_9BACL|nr:DUF6470 family protein [Paenibacillus sp. JX-17]MDO7906564.1 DUF6470 family protein [Paenibacillus sp. JX-17]